jgi:putative NADH-flavin reductase
MLEGEVLTKPVAVRTDWLLASEGQMKTLACWTVSPVARETCRGSYLISRAVLSSMRTGERADAALVTKRLSAYGAEGDFGDQGLGNVACFCVSRVSATGMSSCLDHELGCMSMAAAIAWWDSARYDRSGRNSLTRGRNMRLTIIAATGAVGRELLEQALAAGHDVTAVVRNPGKLSREVRAVTADMAAPDPAALESAIAGRDAVLSGLGPHSNSDAGIASRGTRALVAAMGATTVRRGVAVSAAPVSTVPSPGRPNPPKHDPGDGFFMRYLFSRIASARFGKVYVDLALMEDILADSDLEWTVVRPPQLTDKPATGTYRTAYGQNLRGGLSVPRADVAHLMLGVLDRPETIHKTIGIAS